MSILVRIVESDRVGGVDNNDLDSCIGLTIDDNKKRTKKKTDSSDFVSFEVSTQLEKKQIQNSEDEAQLKKKKMMDAEVDDEPRESESLTSAPVAVVDAQQQQTQEPNEVDDDESESSSSSSTSPAVELPTTATTTTVPTQESEREDNVEDSTETEIVAETISDDLIPQSHHHEQDYHETSSSVTQPQEQAPSSPFSISNARDNIYLANNNHERDSNSGSGRSSNGDISGEAVYRNRIPIIEMVGVHNSNENNAATLATSSSSVTAATIISSSARSSGSGGDVESSNSSATLESLRRRIDNNTYYNNTLFVLGEEEERGKPPNEEIERWGPTPLCRTGFVFIIKPWVSIKFLILHFVFVSKYIYSFSTQTKGKSKEDKTEKYARLIREKFEEFKRKLATLSNSNAAVTNEYPPPSSPTLSSLSLISPSMSTSSNSASTTIPLSTSSLSR